MFSRNKKRRITYYVTNKCFFCKEDKAETYYRFKTTISTLSFDFPYWVTTYKEISAERCYDCFKIHKKQTEWNPITGSKMSSRITFWSLSILFLVIELFFIRYYGGFNKYTILATIGIIITCVGIYFLSKLFENKYCNKHGILSENEYERMRIEE